MLNHKDINRLEQGIMPYSLKGAPFVVMRSAVKMFPLDTAGWQYLICIDPSDKEHTEVSKETAFRIIDANGMKCSHTDRDGRIYELPGNPFFEKFNKKS